MSDHSVQARLVGDRCVIVAVGEFDLYSSPRLRDVLLDQFAAGSQRLVVDLTGVTFLDSSALGVLVLALKRSRVNSGSVRLVCPEGRTMKTLGITGLTQLFEIDETVEEALASES